MVAIVSAGPTVRKDDAANAITTSTAVPEAKPPATDEPPVGESASTPGSKLQVSNDEQSSNATSTVASAMQTTGTESTTAALSTTVTSSTSKPTTVSTTLSTTTKPPVSGVPTAPTIKPPRKTITFDQRQEGKYNIRADLENFVIVVVPSGSSSGASLLDLLTRSAHKKDAHHQTRKTSHKRKNNKAHGVQKKISQVTPEVIVLDENHQRSGQLETEEFIEGRTPYKVDLSSSARSVDGADTDAGPNSSDRKPSFTFSVEPASSSRLIRFPASSGNYPHPHTARAFSVDGHGNGRALRVGGYPNTNTLVVAAGSSSDTNNHLLPGDGDNPQRDGTTSLLLLRRSDDAGNVAEPERDGIAGDNGLVVYHSHHPPSSFDSLEFEPLRSDVDMTQLQLQSDNEFRYDDLEQNDADTLDGDWDELRLLGAQEQCGPDRKRDSYGVCQFVQP
ncbi:uncharacterized protein LOC125762134 isoform X2 [Anopheles funestus]|nr:uncharacterized protein LOC125762134 isoform X2 [Anopheles funestus]